MLAHVFRIHVERVGCWSNGAAEFRLFESSIVIFGTRTLGETKPAVLFASWRLRCAFVFRLGSPSISFV
jgi:hypothetical protein